MTLTTKLVLFSLFTRQVNTQKQMEHMLQIPTHNSNETNKKRSSLLHYAFPLKTYHYANKSITKRTLSPTRHRKVQRNRRTIFYCLNWNKNYRAFTDFTIINSLNFAPQFPFLSVFTSQPTDR